MDDNNFSLVVPPPLPESVPVIQETTPPKVKKTMKPWMIVLIILAVLIMVAISCIATLFISNKIVSLEKEPAADVIDEFLLNMSQKDYANAYELFSPRAKKTVQLSLLKRFTEDDYFFVYKDFSNLTILEFTILHSVNSDPDMPQGKTAKVSGEVHYTDGITGYFDSVLEKVDGKWMIFNINVTVPPDKLK